MVLLAVILILNIVFIWDFAKNPRLKGKIYARHATEPWNYFRELESQSITFDLAEYPVVRPN